MTTLVTPRRSLIALLFVLTALLGGWLGAMLAMRQGYGCP